MRRLTGVPVNPPKKRPMRIIKYPPMVDVVRIAVCVASALNE